MPKRRRCSSSSERKTGRRRRRAEHRKAKCVERAGAIAPDDHAPGSKILHRQAKRVKFHRATIINSELANGKEIFDNIRSDKDIIKVKRAGKDRVSY